MFLRIPSVRLATVVLASVLVLVASHVLTTAQDAGALVRFKQTRETRDVTISLHFSQEVKRALKRDGIPLGGGEYDRFEVKYSEPPPANQHQGEYHAWLGQFMYSRTSYSVHVILWSESDSRSFYLPLSVRSIRLPLYLENYQYSALLVSGGEEPLLHLRQLRGELRVDSSSKLDLRWDSDETFPRKVSTFIETPDGKRLGPKELSAYGAIEWAVSVGLGWQFSKELCGSFPSASLNDSKAEIEDDALPATMYTPRQLVQQYSSINVSDDYGHVDFGDLPTSIRRVFEDQSLEHSLGVFRLVRIEPQCILPDYLSDYSIDESLKFRWFIRPKNLSEQELRAWDKTLHSPGHNLDCFLVGSTATAFVPPGFDLYLHVESDLTYLQKFAFAGEKLGEVIRPELTALKYTQHLTFEIPISNSAELPSVDVVPHIADVAMAREGGATFNHRNIPDFIRDFEVDESKGLIAIEIFYQDIPDTEFYLIDGGALDYRRFILADPVRLTDFPPNGRHQFPELPAPEIETETTRWRFSAYCHGQELEVPYVASQPSKFVKVPARWKWNTRLDIPERVSILGEEFAVTLLPQEIFDNLVARVELPARLHIVSGDLNKRGNALVVLPGRLSRDELQAPFDELKKRGCFVEEWQREARIFAPIGNVTIVTAAMKVTTVTIDGEKLNYLRLSYHTPRRPVEGDPIPMDDDTPMWFSNPDTRIYPYPLDRTVSVRGFPRYVEPLLPGQQRSTTQLLMRTKIPEEARSQGWVAEWKNDQGFLGYSEDELRGADCLRASVAPGHIKVVSGYYSYPRVELEFETVGESVHHIDIPLRLKRHFSRNVRISIPNLRAEDAEKLYFRVYPDHMLEIWPYQIRECALESQLCGMGTLLPPFLHHPVYDREGATFYHALSRGTWIILPYWDNSPLQPIRFNTESNVIPTLKLNSRASATVSEDWLYNDLVVRSLDAGMNFVDLTAFQTQFYNGASYMIPPGEWEVAFYQDGVSEPLTANFTVAPEDTVVPLPEPVLSRVKLFNKPLGKDDIDYAKLAEDDD